MQPGLSPCELAFNRVDALRHVVTAAIADSRALLQQQQQQQPPPPPAATPHSLAKELRAETRATSSLLAASRAQREQIFYYYKVVAKLRPPKGCNDPPRYFSIYDGEAQEFALGRRAERRPCQGRRGAFFVYHDPAEASSALRGHFPASSKLANAPRALLRVSSKERHPRTVHGSKAMLWSLTPVAEVATRQLSGLCDGSTGAHGRRPRWRA